METSFFVGREKIVAKRGSTVSVPFKQLFMWLSKMALDVARC